MQVPSELLSSVSSQSVSSQSNSNRLLANKEVSKLFKGRFLDCRMLLKQKLACVMLFITNLLVATCFPSITSYRHLSKEYVVYTDETDSKKYNLNRIFIVCFINNGGFLLFYAISTITALNYLITRQDDRLSSSNDTIVVNPS